MSLSRHLRIVIACFAALALIAVLGGCGKKEHPGEPVREGLTTPLGGLRYRVYITRQLNLKNEQDRGYYQGAEPAPGHALYGVFLEACNHGDAEAVASSSFEIHDTQENVFKPKASDSKNPFMWHGGAVEPENCEPAIGSVAKLGPASGAMILFDLPISATENRPLELHIQGPFNPGKGKNDSAIIELDV
jgi:hypothetical protein